MSFASETRKVVSMRLVGEHAFDLLATGEPAFSVSLMLEALWLDMFCFALMMEEYLPVLRFENIRKKSTSGLNFVCLSN